ncbi:MAG TPA: response regulator [Armatimonadetes bacterium]|nr:response regulator [Armatimonadota bacterium]
MGESLRILLVEDCSADVLLVQGTLERAGMRAEITTVAEAEAFWRELEKGQYEVVIADYQLPQFDGLEALRLCRERWPNLPFIILTGTGSEEIAVEALRRGADDYVLKKHLNQLPAAVRRAVAFRATQREQEQLQRELAASERRWRTILEQSLDAIGVIRDGQFVYVNPRFTELFGYPWQPGQTLDVFAMLGSEREREIARQRQAAAEAGDRTLPLQEYHWRCADGTVKYVEVSSAPVEWEGRPADLVILRDITSRKHREELFTVLRNVGLAVRHVEDLEMLFQTVSEELKRLGVACYILRYDPAREALRVERVALATSIRQKVEALLQRATVGFEVSTKAFDQWNQLARGEAVFVEDITKYVRAALPGPLKALTPALTELLGVHRCMAVGLLAGGEVWGVMSLLSDLLQEEDTEFFQLFGQFISSALENARLYRELEEFNRTLEQRVAARTSELQTLYELSQRIGYVLDYDELLRLVHASLYRSVTYEVVATLLWTDRRKELLIQSTRPLREGAYRWLRERALRVVEELSEVPIEQVQVKVYPAEEFEAHAPSLSAPLASFFAAPLIVQEQTLGVMCIASTQEHAFAEENMRVFYALANQTALAVHRLEALLQAEQSRLEAIVHSLTDGILLLDLEGRLAVANPAARELLKTLTGESSPERLTHLGGVELLPLLERVVQTGQSVRQEITIGAEWPRLLEVTLSLVRSGPSSLPPARGGKEGEVVLTLRDLTEERQRQEQIFRQSKLASIGELAAGVAHEINNPLQAVVGYADLALGREDLEEGLRNDLEQILQAGLRAAEIVQNLLNFARTQREVSKRPLSVREAVEQALRLVQSQLAKENVRVVAEYDENLPPVWGNLGQLEETVLNLVQNAKDAIVDAKKGGMITVRVQRRLGGLSGEEEGVVLEVEDDGPGIPPEVQSHILNPFFTTKDPGKGTGLGLSIVHTIVREHGGQLTFHSQPGQGATFTVWLPAYGEEHPSAVQPASPAPKTKLKPARLLVVDDEKMVLDLLAAMGKAAGHQIETISDPQEALERLKRENYDLIFLDLRMPGLTGQELYAALQTCRPELARRVVFLTGDVARETTQEFLKTAGRPVMSKPITTKQFQACIARMLAR